MFVIYSIPTAPAPPLQIASSDAEGEAFQFILIRHCFSEIDLNQLERTCQLPDRLRRQKKAGGKMLWLITITLSLVPVLPAA